MKEQEKKCQKMICLTLKPSQSLFFLISRIQNKEFLFPETELIKEKEAWGIEQKRKGFLIALATAIKKGPTTSIRKYANELKVHEKTIKQDLSLDPNPLDYALCGVLENKTNATSHPNIGSHKIAIEEEWNRMSEEFILKACKSFRRCVDTITGEKMAAILSKFTVLCLSSYFVVYFF